MGARHGARCRGQGDALRTGPGEFHAHRALEVAAVPPITVNWGGSHTVSAEEYCAYLGELAGVEPVFEYSPDAHTPLWPDVSLMHRTLGRTRIDWREGFRRMVEARHPELLAGRQEKHDGQ